MTFLGKVEYDTHKVARGEPSESMIRLGGFGETNSALQGFFFFKTSTLPVDYMLHRA